MKSVIPPKPQNPTLYFDNTTEKLSAVRAFNQLLVAADLPKVHEGLDQSSIYFAIYLCIVETRVDPQDGKTP